MASVRDSPMKMIPVFCNAEIPEKILNRFLDEAYSSIEEKNRRLCILTTEDPILEPQPSTQPVEEFTSPFLGTVALNKLIETVSSHEKITDHVFVLLDSVTSTDGHTCRLVSRKVAHFFSVRSDFSSAQVALEAILDGSSNMQRLSNEAAIAGGVLKSYLLTKSAAAVDQDEDVVEFQNRPPNATPWEECCKPRYGDQCPVCIPVFCTADIPLEVLNTFIKRVYDRPDCWSGDAPVGIRVIDTLDLAELQSAQTRAPLTKPFTSPFLHKTPQAINRIVKSQLAGTSLNCVVFVILDSVTPTNETCILTDNQPDEDPFLLLVRGDFPTALATLNATTCTSLKLETVAESATGTSDGVYRE